MRTFVKLKFLKYSVNKLEMGVRRLNLLLKQTCSDCIRKIKFADLYGKKIVIDVSVYMYKYIQEGALIDNFYLLIGLFKKYNITPIFIFDGKPPEEKKEILISRSNDRRRAEAEYIKTESKLNNLKEQVSLKNQEEIFALERRLSILKAKKIRVTCFHIIKVKELMDAMGAHYLDADGEADVLCAQLVKSKLVCGCLSEDMDMFVYGCERVYRDIEIYDESMICYEYKNILKKLKMSSKEFREICVYSGTDYNEKTNIFHVIKLFKNFKKSKETEFYQWLQKNNYITDIIKLYQTYFMFDILPKKIKLEKKSENISNLRSILEKNNFMFI